MLLAAFLFIYAWCVLLIVGCATLHLFSLLFSLETKSSYSTSVILIGIASLTSVISWLHLWLPIGAFMHAVLLLMVIIYTIFQRDRLANLFSSFTEANKQQAVFMLLLFFISIVSITSRSGSGDIADYHLQGIKWAEFYPNIKGLGNFNKPLANNYWWFNIQAFFGLHFLGIKSVYVMNAVIYCAVFLLLIERLKQGYYPWLILTLLAFMTLSIKTAFIGAVTPDVFINYIVLALFVEAICAQKNQASFISLLWLVLFSITVKITALMLMFYVLVICIMAYKQQFFLKNTLLKFGMLSFTLLILPWLIGNVIQSGYLIPLINQIDLFDLDWKIPGHFIEAERTVIMEWSKIPGAPIEYTRSLSFVEWFPAWVRQYDPLNKGLIILYLLCLPFSIWKVSKKRNNKEDYFFSGIVLSAHLGLILLFILSPQMRFMFGFVIVAIGLGMQQLFPIIKPPIKTIYITLILACGSLTGLKLFTMHTQIGLQHILVKPMDYNHVFFEKTNWGKETIYITQQNNSCWDQFPCTYYLLDGTVMRGETLATGFKQKQ